MILLNITRLSLYLGLGIVFYFDVPFRYWGLPALFLYDWNWYVPFFYKKPTYGVPPGELYIPNILPGVGQKKVEGIKWN